DSPVDSLIDLGILPILIHCLTSENAGTQFEAAWALTNIAAGTNEHTQAVVHAGAVPKLFNLLQSGNRKVTEQAVWALGNIIGDGPHSRDDCINLGIVDSLLKFIDPEISVGFLRTVNWVLVNLCRSNDPPLTAEIIKQLLSAFVGLIRHKDTKILVGIVWALYSLTDGGNEQIEMVVESGAVPDLILLLGHSDVKVQTTALRAVRNISTGCGKWTPLLLDNGILRFFPELLSHSHYGISKEAVWLMSHITAVNAVVNAVNAVNHRCRPPSPRHPSAREGRLPHSEGSCVDSVQSDHLCPSRPGGQDGAGGHHCALLRNPRSSSVDNCSGGPRRNQQHY
ncbi:hypothetical protein PFISCL1PPCAC_8147, partial [Pristionchus fissidentatus]